MSDGRPLRVKLHDVSKAYPLGGEMLSVLDGISVDVFEDEFVAIVGPSGCGKSTLLNIISGLTPPSDGMVTVEPTRAAVQLAFVFQDPTLLDWRTVRENLRFALRGLGVPESEHDEHIRQALDLVGLSDFGDQYPPRLSGGMQQRVGFARAFCVEPDVLLMDEPFGSLDELTARTLRQKVLDVWRAETFTGVLVTHNIEEAVYLSDRVMVLSDQPTTIEKTVDIEIDRPRDPSAPEILEYERTILDALGVPVGAGETDTPNAAGGTDTPGMETQE